jgi:hypothetical protein
MTTFGNGTCEISQEFTKDMSEDQVNVTKEYRKPRTKVRKMLTFLTSDPPIKVSPGHNLLFYYTAIYIYLRILCIKFLGIS